jgi:hypothetical protein
LWCRGRMIRGNAFQAVPAWVENQYCPAPTVARN